MKKLLIDIDEVLCQSTFLDEINKFLNTNFNLEDFKEYYIDGILGSHENKEKFYDKIKCVDLYSNARIFDDAVGTLKELNEKYDIYICSACVMACMPNDSGIYFKHKFDFLIKNFPFLDPNKFIFTGAKNLFNADIQIDDRLDNLQGNVEKKLLFTSYHNKNLTEAELKSQNIIRVNNWKEIKNILLNG